MQVLHLAAADGKERHLQLRDHPAGAHLRQAAHLDHDLRRALPEHRAVGQVLLRERRHRGDRGPLHLRRRQRVPRRALDLEDRRDGGAVHRRGGEAAAVHDGGGEGDPGGHRAREAAAGAGGGGGPAEGGVVPGVGVARVRGGEVARHGHGQPHARRR